MAERTGLKPNLDHLDAPIRELVSEVFDMHAATAEFIGAAADNLLDGGNPYRMGHTMRKTADSFNASLVRLAERIGNLPAIEHNAFAVAEHYTDVSGWVSACSCGWRGEWRLSRESAEDVAGQHVRDVKGPGGIAGGILDGTYDTPNG